MKNVVTYLKDHKKPILRGLAIAVGTGAAIAIVGYVATRGGEAIEVNVLPVSE